MNMKTFKEYLSEASLGRLWQHFTRGEPMVIISADRSERTKSENKSCFEKLKQNIRLAKFGYVKVKGGYTETDAEGNKHDVDDENSCVIFGTPETEKRLFVLGLRLGKAYNQECFLWVGNDNIAYWVYTINDDVRNIRIGEKVRLGEFHTKKIGQYFSKIGKKQFSFTQIDESEDKHSSFTTIEMQSSDRFIRMLDEDVSELDFSEFSLQSFDNYRKKEEIKEKNRILNRLKPFSSSIELIEASLSRLWQHFNKGNPLMIITSDRGDRDTVDNNRKYRELRKDLIISRFGYVKVKGGYTEIDKEGNKRDFEEEKSCIVFGTPDTEKRLLKLGKVLGKKYEQECFLFVGSDGVAKWIFTDETNKVITLGEFHTKQIGDYYTKIGKKHFSFTCLDNMTEEFIKSALLPIDRRNSDSFVEFLDS